MNKDSRKRALISVSDKTGVAELARELVLMGWEIISTGGTAAALHGAGIDVTGVDEVTGFPEIFEGRVKTLNPMIHGGILVRPDQPGDRRQMDEQGIKPITLVAVNLYPFAETVARAGVTLPEAVENIDIGGPAMVRAAAKNYAHVAVVVNPRRYGQVLAELAAGGEVTPETRFSLAAEAFAHTAGYDAMIAGYLAGLPGSGTGIFPPDLSLPWRKVQELSYGENPQQQAAFYACAGRAYGLAAARQLQGKELSFNNLNDLNAAWDLVLEFTEPTVAAIKHANPCGVGSASNIRDAYGLAYDADPVSIFGGVLAANRPVDGAAAREMVRIKLDVVAAPRFTEEAQHLFAQKKNTRLLELDPFDTGRDRFDMKKVAGGLLLQTVDREPVDPAAGEAVTRKKPAPSELRQMAFAQKVVKHVRSNAIVVVREGQTLGVGAGQMSRIAAARIALEQAAERAAGAVLASDAFFPFPDTVEAAAEAGITAIIQPGGSQKDKESIDACDRLGMAMVFTGRRYFKH